MQQSINFTQDVKDALKILQKRKGFPSLSSFVVYILRRYIKANLQK